MPAKFRINLEAVEYYLRTVQKNFDQINDSLDMRREPMRDQIVENMLAGYRYVNNLFDERAEIDIEDPGVAQHMEHLFGIDKKYWGHANANAKLQPDANSTSTNPG